jgi:hypothetical protein
MATGRGPHPPAEINVFLGFRRPGALNSAIAAPILQSLSTAGECTHGNRSKLHQQSEEFASFIDENPNDSGGRGHDVTDERALKGNLAARVRRAAGYFPYPKYPRTSASQ